MAKTTVENITDDIKVLADYDIVDTDLDILILKGINLMIKRMKQWFFDEQLFDEIGKSDTIDTVALQEYVDVGTETIDFDQQVVLAERTNDKPIHIVTFKEYRERFPDPSANSSNTPDIAAFFDNKIYLGPTPSAIITLYLDYIRLVTKLTAGQTLPYEDKYDEVVITGVIEYLVKWLDRGNTAMINSARIDTFQAKKDLIVGASKNVGMNQQSQSRRREIPFFSPRKVI